ncbi:MAG: DUF1361 domain-containing protein [Microthrixaceae bacterium]
MDGGRVVAIERFEEVYGRVAVLVLLAATSAFPLAMLAVRRELTSSIGYRFLFWNLFLAWVPLGFAAIAEFGWRRHWKRRTLLVPLVLWVLFFPNAPYVLTDVIHLRETGQAPVWFDALVLFSAGLAGLLVGFVSLRVVQLIVSASFATVWGWVVALGVLGLSGFGIYLGRFGRHNSWDLLTRPRHLLYNVGTSVDLTSSPKAAAISALFTAFLVVTYLTSIAIGHITLPHRGEPSVEAPPSADSRYP